MNGYKKCLYCAEEILQAANKCKHCGEYITTKEENNNNFSNLDNSKNQVKKNTYVVEKSNALNNFFIFIGVIAIIVVFYSIFISDQNFSSYSSISDANCNEVAKDSVGNKLKNLFGAEFEILQVKNSKEISRTTNKLVCLGDVMLDNGMDDQKLRTELTLKDGQFWYKWSIE